MEFFTLLSIIAILIQGVLLTSTNDQLIKLNSGYKAAASNSTVFLYNEEDQIEYNRIILKNTFLTWVTVILITVIILMYMFVIWTYGRHKSSAAVIQEVSTANPTPTSISTPASILKKKYITADTEFQNDVLIYNHNPMHPGVHRIDKFNSPTNRRSIFSSFHLFKHIFSLQYFLSNSLFHSISLSIIYYIYTSYRDETGLIKRRGRYIQNYYIYSKRYHSIHQYIYTY